ncbi:MAG: tail fiber domain-containing protein [Bacteroidales bacterium]|nr:tail fiber domain-containing protein [Bacteroidales bacterium]
MNSQWLNNSTGIYYSDGYVGIGAPPSTYNLDVQGSYPFQRIKATYGWAGITIDKAAATDNGYLVHQQGGIYLWAEGTIGDNNFCIRNWGLASDAMNVNWANNDVTFSGRVGIKTNPSFDLNINSTDYTAAYITTPYSGGTAFEVIAPGAGNTWAVYSMAPTTGYAGYFSGNVFCSGSYLPSDEKLKENIRPMQDALDDVMKLDVKTYEFRTTEFPELNLPPDRQNGFTAQNLESVFPELVKLNPAKKEQPTEFKAVNYTGMIPVLTAAIQEQQAEIEQLREQNALLLSRLSRLEAVILK